MITHKQFWRLAIRFLATRSNFSKSLLCLGLSVGLAVTGHNYWFGRLPEGATAFAIVRAVVIQALILGSLFYSLGYFWNYFHQADKQENKGSLLADCGIYAALLYVLAVPVLHDPSLLVAVALIYSLAGLSRRWRG